MTSGETWKKLTFSTRNAIKSINTNTQMIERLALDWVPILVTDHFWVLYICMMMSVIRMLESWSRFDPLYEYHIHSHHQALRGRLRVHRSKELRHHNCLENDIKRRRGKRWVVDVPINFQPSSFTWYRLHVLPEKASRCPAAKMLRLPSSCASSSERSQRYPWSRTPYANVLPDPTEKRSPLRRVPSEST